jgi:multiple sugar transport system ATP-binding protein
MNFIRFNGTVNAGDAAVMIDGNCMEVPRIQESYRGEVAFGVRPEHVRLTDAGSYRGEVKATEYLGTTQIVTLLTANGNVKARLSSATRIHAGETVGLEFAGSTVTLFDTQTGRALRSSLNEGVLANG